MRLPCYGETHEHTHRVRGEVRIIKTVCEGEVSFCLLLKTKLQFTQQQFKIHIHI